MNHTVCITGTTRGIGLEFAKQYAEAGWEVLACSRHPESPALQALKSKHTNVSILELDVCNESQIEKLKNHLQDKPIDLLINSAGIYGKEEKDDTPDQALDTVSSEAMLEVFKVNAIAPLMVSRSLLSNVAKGQLKTIVTITSRGGSIGDNTSGGVYAYRASKAAVNMVMKSLSVDLKSRGIKVLLMHPGHVKTDMGGAGALIDAETSVKGMRHVIEEKMQNSSIDTENIFFNYQGQTLPW
jgi:NAD(P)-dependent dehydrogenase (short-subunit alcohol dehydrogenase family)